MNYDNNPEMAMAWQFVAETSHSIFLTGKAGTGKTTFLRQLREASPKRMAVVAPTGVAAINAGGQTIHSFFQLPLGPHIPGMQERSGHNAFRMPQYKKDIIRTLDLLVIDEISMVRADLLDLIDETLRKYRDWSKPFGGVQMLLIGDLMQLSPVAKTEEWQLLSQHYATPYFFSSHALQQLSYATIELKHIYRQQDSTFINLLAKVRTGSLNAHDVAMLNSRHIPNFRPTDSSWIYLSTHNFTVNSYNERRLAMLPSAPMVFEAVTRGEFPESSYPADAKLVLKKGAQVMFVRNDPTMAHAYYNGKIGVVVGKDEDGVVVSCDNGKELITVAPTDWTNVKYNLDPNTKEIKEEEVGTFTQYPLRLAWAITVHKSQGLTFDHAVLDINASFAHGQAYVALSRCRSLEGLVLASPLDPRSIITDTAVNSYVDAEMERSKHNAEQLPSLKLAYAISLLDDLYSFKAIDSDLARLQAVARQHLARKNPTLMQSLDAASSRLQAEVHAIAERFRPQYVEAMQAQQGQIEGTPIAQRITKSADYFWKKLNEILPPIIKQAATVNIENKGVLEIYNNALIALRTAAKEKMDVLWAVAESEFTTANYLNIKAQSALSGAQPTKKTKRAKKEKAPKPEKPKAEKKKKGDSAMVTLEMFQRGMKPADIAKERGLTEGTIFAHLANIANKGLISVDEIVDPVRQQAIKNAINTFSEAYTMTDVKKLLPEDYSFGEIRLVIESMR